MNVENTLKLNSWVLHNEDRLRSPERGTLADIAASAAKKLDCKVTASNLAAVLRAHDIPTRKPSERDTEIERYKQMIVDLEAENSIMRRTLAKVAVASHIPDEYKDYILGNLPAEIRGALGVVLKVSD